MPYPVRNSLLLVIFSLLIITAGWAQQKNAPMPIPDFSRAVDLNEYRPFEYQNSKRHL